jgi:hypothetical protein
VYECMYMKNTNRNSDTLLSYWLFFTHRSSCFAVSLQTFIPHLHSFLSLSYSFLLFPTMMWNSNCQKFRTSMTWKNPGNLAFHTKFRRPVGHRSLKPIKPEFPRENLDKWNLHLKHECHLKISLTHTLQTLEYCQIYCTGNGADSRQRVLLRTSPP